MSDITITEQDKVINGYKLASNDTETYGYRDMVHNVLINLNDPIHYGCQSF